MTGTRVPGSPRVPGSDVQPYALVVSGDIECAVPLPVPELLRVSKAPGGTDVSLAWPDPTTGEIPTAWLVATFDRSDDFVTPNLLGETTSRAHDHPDALHDGRTWYYLVAARDRCGRVSPWR